VPSDVRLFLGDCLDVLPTIESGSADAVITDPPYPEIDRPYGRLTEAEWFDLMRKVVPECMRVLKPTGSAVFVLQPNSERVGRMRTWLWDFMSWVGKTWGVVQDAYWWNTSAMPLSGACEAGLMRPSLKYCVWVGPEDCYRNQKAVLLPESESNRRDRLLSRFNDEDAPSRRRSDTEQVHDNMRRLRAGVVERGGVTPFNVLPVGSSSPASGGTFGHGAATPMPLADWWARYIVPPGGVVLDPFCGSGTTGISAVKRGHDYIGVEKMPEYHAIAERRVREAQEGAALPLFDEPTPEPAAVGYKQQTFAEAEGV
jgi:DNA modification methylase